MRGCGVQVSKDYWVVGVGWVERTGRGDSLALGCRCGCEADGLASHGAELGLLVLGQGQQACARLGQLVCLGLMEVG